MMKTEDERWMERCLQLARCGWQGAPPNPMVGAVIVCDGQIIGEGFHARCGEAHAEVNAFASVKHPELLSRSWMYVSLEPCAHFGRTPPCARLIIEKGVPEVVVGCIDPFAKVHGLGVQMLRDAGVKVRVGVLEAECLALNRRFITCQTLHRPYVTLKWAESADGFIDVCREGGEPARISSPHTLLRVHHLRALHQAILVGRRTAELDNPSLTLRYWAGANPLRIVMDRHGVLPASLRLFDGSAPTLVAGEENPAERARSGHYEFLPLKYDGSELTQLLHTLSARGVQSLLVEGGRQLLQSFIDQRLWDEAHVEHGALQLHAGVAAPKLPDGMLCEVESIWNTTILKFTVDRRDAGSTLLRPESN